MLTTKKITTGEFDVLWNGKPTDWQIVNGSRGMSGNDSPNVYGFVRNGRSPKWVGTLATCKKVLALTLRKESVA